jgi:sugar phosphate isomerase/epimerase
MNPFGHRPNRRKFLKELAGATLAGAALHPISAAFAVEPFKRPGAPRLALSLAAYSFRDSFKTAAPHHIDMFDFVDFCADHGCEGAELTSYYFPTPITDEFLIKLKRHAFLRGVAISGSAVGNNFALPAGEKRSKEIKLVKDWIDHAALLGAPHIRVFAGPKPKDIDLAEAKKLCIEGLDETADYAGSRGIFLGLENHGGIVAEPEGLLEIVKAVKSPWLGVNLDTGNFQTDDPYADLARCAPYAVNVQLKVEITRRNKKSEPSDLPGLIRILRDANYQGYVALEYEGSEDPWQSIPGWLGRMKQVMA